MGGGAEQPHIFCLARPHAPSPRASRRHRTSPRDSSHHYRRATAPSAPRSAPPAATLRGGLRPGSFRVHDPCKEARHGSRLGFPGRRLPMGPAAPGNVARALQVLPQQARRVSAGGRGELGLDPAEPGLRPAGVPPPERSATSNPFADRPQEGGDRGVRRSGRSHLCGTRTAFPVQWDQPPSPTRRGASVAPGGQKSLPPKPGSCYTSGRFQEL